MTSGAIRITIGPGKDVDRMVFRKAEEKGELFSLVSPDGSRAWFEFLEMAVVDGVEYAALLEAGDDAPVVLRMTEDPSGGAEQYETVEDEALFGRVSGILFAMLKEED